MLMDLREEQVGGVTVVQIKGRLDSTTSPTLGERLSAMLGAAKARIVVDFSQLEYISSAGFRVLLQAAKRADQNAAKLVLCGVSGKVRQLFELGGFLDLFAISASRDEAITSAG
jgi:anti-anti-sigma factor